MPMMNAFPFATSVPPSTIAAEATAVSESPWPTKKLPLVVSVTPGGIWVTCQVPLVLFVYCRLVMAVLTLTTLLTVVAFAEVPVTPNWAVSVEPGLPVAGNQLALTFQLLAPGEATFHTNVVAAKTAWAVNRPSEKSNGIRYELGFSFI